MPKPALEAGVEPAEDDCWLLGMVRARAASMVWGEEAAALCLLAGRVRTRCAPSSLTKGILQRECRAGGSALPPARFSLPRACPWGAA